MILHFHVGQTAFTIALSKGADLQREIEEKTEALLDIGMCLPIEGARARYVLRRWARASRLANSTVSPRRARGARMKLRAYGLRNPSRFSWRSSASCSLTRSSS